MASLRRVKKDIDYLVSEVVYDCYLALYFHSERRDAIVAVMEEAVDARNEFTRWRTIRPRNTTNPW